MVYETVYHFFVLFFPPSAKIKIWPERSGHDFEPTQVRSCFEARPYSKPAKVAD